MFRTFKLFIFTLLISVSAVHANSNWATSENIRGRIIDEQGALGVEIEAAKGWHFYYKEPGDAGLATMFDFKDSRNFNFQDIIWPEHKVLNEYGFKVNAYEELTYFPIKAKIGQNALINLTITGSVCKEICIPFELKFSYVPQMANAADGGTDSILYILFIALMAGLILNIMPCVLPVLSLKVLSVLKQTGKERKHARLNFMATAAGIISSFIALALIAISLKSAGMAVGWGLHFQSPVFVAILLLITFFFALSLFGFFHLQPPSWLSGSGEHKNSFGGNFLSGVLATLLGTSCTAPVLVTAVGYALAGGTGTILLIFIVMGIGMALPFLIFAARPSLVKHLPKPGKWMVKVKYVLGALLLATTVWLGFILYAQTSGGMEKSGWAPFNESAIETLVTENTVVFVDITAKWCVNCKANKVTVIDTEEMQKFFTDNGVVLMQGDMTKPMPELLAYIKKFDRYGIPVNVVYGPNAKEGILLDSLLSKDAVKKAVAEAKGS